MGTRLERLVKLVQVHGSDAVDNAMSAIRKILPEGSPAEWAEKAEQLLRKTYPANAGSAKRIVAQGSREAVPGSNTGHMQELLTSPFSVRKWYTDAVMPKFSDVAGNDRIAKARGMKTAGSFEGPGVYEGINPGRQFQYEVDAARANPGARSVEDAMITEPSLADMRANEALYGLLSGQKAIAGHGFVPDPHGNAFEIFRDAGPMTYGEGQNAADAVRRFGLNIDNMAIVPSASGVRVQDFGSDPGQMARFRDYLASDMSGDVRRGNFEGIYEENPWDTPEGALGQKYLKYILPEGNQTAVDQFNAVAPDIAGSMRDFDQRFAKDYGFDISKNIDDIRAAIAGGGESGLRDLIRKRGYAAGGAVERDLVNAAGNMGLLNR